MSAGRYTSRVFVAGEAIKSKLDAVSFPAHPVTGEAVSVEFSDEDPDGVNEYIAVQLNVDDSRIEWRRFSPPGANEQLLFEVTFRSYVPCGYTSAEVWDRLKTVSDAIQEVFYDHTAETVQNLGFDGEVGTTLVTAVRPTTFPTSDGWMGSVTHVIDVSAQI